MITKISVSLIIFILSISSVFASSSFNLKGRESSVHEKLYQERVDQGIVTPFYECSFSDDLKVTIYKTSGNIGKDIAVFEEKSGKTIIRSADLLLNTPILGTYVLIAGINPDYDIEYQGITNIAGTIYISDNSFEWLEDVVNASKWSEDNEYEDDEDDLEGTVACKSLLE